MLCGPVEPVVPAWLFLTGRQRAGPTVPSAPPRVATPDGRTRRCRGTRPRHRRRRRSGDADGAVEVDVLDRVEQLDASNGKLYGDLTIKDVTKPVVLNLEFAGLAKSPWGTTSAGFSAETKINRKDWNLGWNVALEAGGWLVGEDVKIAIELELVKVVEQPAEAASA